MFRIWTATGQGYMLKRFPLLETRFALHLAVGKVKRFRKLFGFDMSWIAATRPAILAPYPATYPHTHGEVLQADPRKVLSWAEPMGSIGIR